MLPDNVKNTAIVALNTSEMNQSSSVALNVPAAALHEPENGSLLFSRTESKCLNNRMRDLPQAVSRL